MKYGDLFTIQQCSTIIHNHCAETNYGDLTDEENLQESIMISNYSDFTDIGNNRLICRKQLEKKIQLEMKKHLI